MTRPAFATQSTFPTWVALGSLAVVLWVFFSNTAPAVRERAALRSLDQELSALRLQYDQAIEDHRLGRGLLAKDDLQSLLIAIDQHELTPAELCQLFPAPAPEATAPGGPGTEGADQGKNR